MAAQGRRVLLTRGWNYLTILFKAVIAARRWLIAYLLLILLPASLLLYIYSVKSSGILEDEVTRTMLQTLKQAEINLDYQFNSVRDTSNSIFMNPKLHQYLSGSTSYLDQLDIIKELRYLVSNAQTNPNVFQVRLFVDSSKYFSNERVNFFPWESIKNRAWYQEVVDAGGLIVWTGAYRETYIDKEDAYIFSGARILRDPDRYDELSGVLVLDVAVKTIEDILAKMELNKQQHVFMVAPDGTIVLHGDKSLLGTKLKSKEVLHAIELNNDGVSYISEGTDRFYVIYTTIRSTGWKLVAQVPKSEISSRAVALNRISSVATLSAVTILFLVLVFILLAFIVRGMNRRVQTAIRSIKREGMEWLDERGGGTDGDFNLLEKSIDHLIHRVHALMEETYLSKVQEREAQLRALQAQINPHFLYNTLDTINWIAIGRGADDISQMIDGLAKYFRLSLNKGRDLVSVGDELNLAKVYLEIQQSRFPKSFEFEFQADDGLEHDEMPKLTLQPLVENALMHGIRKSKGKSGKILIRASKEGEDLVLSVTDDGIGMEQELADSLLTEPRPTMRSDGSGSSYGLYNVHERIRLFAGENYGLRVQSEPGEGTTVTVRFRSSNGKRR
jgi:two-component system, sensor histidine kinase YesM